MRAACGGKRQMVCAGRMVVPRCFGYKGSERAAAQGLRTLCSGASSTKCFGHEKQYSLIGGGVACSVEIMDGRRLVPEARAIVKKVDRVLMG